MMTSTLQQQHQHQHQPLQHEGLSSYSSSNSPKSISLSLGTLPPPPHFPAAGTASNSTLASGQRSAPITHELVINRSSASGLGGMRSAQLFDEATLANTPRTPGGSLAIGSEIFGFGRLGGGSCSANTSSRDRWGGAGSSSTAEGDISPAALTPRGSVSGATTTSNDAGYLSSPWPIEFEQALSSNGSGSSSTNIIKGSAPSSNNFELTSLNDSSHHRDFNLSSTLPAATHPSIRSYNSSIDTPSSSLLQVDADSSSLTSSRNPTPSHLQSRPVLGRSKSNIVGDSTGHYDVSVSAVEDDSKLNYGFPYGVDAFPSSTSSFSTAQQQQPEQRSIPSQQRALPPPERSASFSSQLHSQYYDHSLPPPSSAAAATAPATTANQQRSNSTHDELLSFGLDHLSLNNNNGNSDQSYRDRNSFNEGYMAYQQSLAAAAMGRSPNGVAGGFENFGDYSDPAAYYRRGSNGSIGGNFGAGASLDMRSRDSGYAASPPHFNHHPQSGSSSSSTMPPFRDGHPHAHPQHHHYSMPPSAWHPDYNPIAAGGGGAGSQLSSRRPSASYSSPSASQHTYGYSNHNGGNNGNIAGNHQQHHHHHRHPSFGISPTDHAGAAFLLQMQQYHLNGINSGGGGGGGNGMSNGFGGYQGGGGGSGGGGGHGSMLSHQQQQQMMMMMRNGNGGSRSNSIHDYASLGSMHPHPGYTSNNGPLHPSSNGRGSISGQGSGGYPMSNENGSGSGTGSGRNGSGSGAAGGDDAGRVVRSPLLEEFRTNRHRSWELFDLVNHIVEFSGDQLGSRHIQQKLDTASTEERQLVFEEIVPNMLQLSTDVFANYVIQKLFEQGTQAQKTAMAKLLEGHVLALSLQMYGCRVVQKALEYVLLDQQVRLIRELDGHVLKCARDAQSNHVVQRALERVPSDQLIFITDACIGQVQALATHPYGCRVLQRIFENCPSSQTRVLLDDLHRYTQNLIQDQYGNYVIQWIVEKGDRADRSLVISKVCGQLLALAQQKFASNVIEKCIIYAEDNDRRRLVDEVLAPTADGSSVVRLMLSHPYANYVFQKILVTTLGPQKGALIAETTNQLNQLRKFSTSYSKHLITIEKLLLSERTRPC